MKYPTSFQTTDCLIINKTTNRILLGRKPKHTKWCFLGGFVDPKDYSLEDANARERIEEAGINLECTYPQYLFSLRVDDERYAEGEDKIMTAMFVSYYTFGFAKAGDDVEEVMWFDINEIKRDYQTILVKKHIPLMDRVITMGAI